MSCAFLNCGRSCDGPEGLGTSSPDCPHSVLANALHAMAQPLTVLRGALGACKLRGPMASGSDRYLDMSEKQVERISELLSCMQDVLDTPDSKPQCTRVDFWKLTRLVLHGMSSVLRDWGGTVHTTESDAAIQIYGDEDRTERALRAALRLAVSLSTPGGAIRISDRAYNGKVEVSVDQTSGHGGNLSFAQRLNLSLVEANILSQGGRFECVEDPLCIRFTLPAYRSDTTDPAAAQYCVPVQLAS